MSQQIPPTDFNDPSGMLPSAAPECVNDGCRACCPLTKAVRVLAGAFVLVGVGAYAAISARPELAEYLSFLPGASVGTCHRTSCSGSASMTAATSCCAHATACSLATSSCGSHTETDGLVVGTTDSGCGTARASLLADASPLSPELTEEAAADADADVPPAPPVARRSIEL